MFDLAFSAWGAGVSWLEALAFLLALGCVLLNVFEIHWAWPLSIASAALYGVLFHANLLYAEACLQVFFVMMSAWGWWQWVYGRRGGDADRPAPLSVVRLRSRQWLWLGMAWIAGWIALGAVLSGVTDSDVAWLDAFPAVGSLIGQVLLARKYLENWTVWGVVNLSTLLPLAAKGLWLSVLLYVIFIGVSVVGWRQWRARLALSPAPGAVS